MSLQLPHEIEIRLVILSIREEGMEVVLFGPQGAHCAIGMLEVLLARG